MYLPDCLLRPFEDLPNRFVATLPVDLIQPGLLESPLAALSSADLLRLRQLLGDLFDRPDATMVASSLLRLFGDKLAARLAILEAFLRSL